MALKDLTLPTLQSRVALLLLMLTGALFVFKYASRILEIPVVATVGYVCACIAVLGGLIAFRMKLARRITGRQIQALVLLLAGGMCVALRFIPTTTRVTRVRALAGWLSYLQHGLFPYNHPSHPSAFPALFLIAAPFRALGDLGYMEVAGWLIFGLLVVRLAPSGEDALLQISMLCVLPTVYYELLVRSDLFANMSLALALVYASEQFGLLRSTRRAFFLISVGFGVILSTRLIVAVIVGIYLIYRLRTRIRDLVLSSLVAAGVFALTLLPFVVWNIEAFVRNGPFARQLTYLPWWAPAAGFAVSCWAGWTAKDRNEYFFLTGCILFAMTAASFASRVGLFGWNAALYQGRFDVSYFVCCTPFLVLSLTWRSQTSRGNA